MFTNLAYNMEITKKLQSQGYHVMCQCAYPLGTPRGSLVPTDCNKLITSVSWHKYEYETVNISVKQKNNLWWKFWSDK
jgi:hypothetical protein